MLRFGMMALALVVAACAPAENPTTETTESKMLPAPTPEAVTIRITAEQAGQTITVPVNERFAVELVGVPTAGYVWQPATLPAFIVRAGEAGGNTIAEQDEPGYAGGNHWEVLMFVANAPGTGELVIEQKRPWETDEAPADTFRVTITAQ